MAQQANVTESEFKRQFLQTWFRSLYNAGTLDAAIATHSFYTGPSNFVNPTLVQTDTPVQARIAYLQSLDQATRVDPATLQFVDFGMGATPTATTLSAYRKNVNPNAAVVYEEQDLAIPLLIDEVNLVDLQANVSEFVLIGPSSAIVEVRVEHMDVANVNPFLPQQQVVARYFVKSYATNSWALCAALCTEEGEFTAFYYPTLDALMSLLAGTRVSFNTNNIPLGQLPPGMNRGMAIFMFIQALGVPQELSQANGEIYTENNSPSNEALFQ
jgi:hypothetical protein